MAFARSRATTYGRRACAMSLMTSRRWIGSSAINQAFADFLLRQPSSYPRCVSKPERSLCKIWCPAVKGPNVGIFLVCPCNAALKPCPGTFATLCRSKRCSNIGSQPCAKRAQCHHTPAPMKLNFKILRQHPRFRQEVRRDAQTRRALAGPCQWKGCEKARSAIKRAYGPWTRGRILSFLRRSRAAVQPQSYNYFDGMNDAEVDEFRKDALTGHRPTWKVGRQRLGARHA